MLWLIVQDRESEKWYLIREMPWETYKKYDIRTNRSKKMQRQMTFVIPSPEDISCFIKDHAIITAESREQACQLTSTFQKQK